MRPLASTVYFHTGSSLMSGSFSDSSGLSWSWAWEPPPPQSRPTRQQIPDFSSSSVNERKKDELVLSASVCSFHLSVFVTDLLSYLHRCCYSPSSSPLPLSGLLFLSPPAPSANPSSPLWNDAGWTLDDGAERKTRAENRQICKIFS